MDIGWILLIIIGAILIFDVFIIILLYMGNKDRKDYHVKPDEWEEFKEWAKKYKNNKKK